MMDAIRNYFGRLSEPPGDILRWYASLDSEQQRSALLLTPIVVGGLFVWVMYQAHGDRVVVVLPALVARLALLLLALPVVLVGRVSGAGWSVPAFLTRDWTAEPVPDRPRIMTRKVDPMKLPNNLLPRMSGLFSVGTGEVSLPSG